MASEVEAGPTARRQGSHRLVPVVLLVAVTANAAMVPLMPYLLATRVGWPLWQVGLYSFAVTAVTIVLNRLASTQVDRGRSLVGMCVLGVIAQTAAPLFAIVALDHRVVLALVVPCLAAGGAIVPVFYAMGRRAAGSARADPGRQNSLLRVATSGGWVLGPAVSFALLGKFGDAVSLALVCGLALVGLAFLGATGRRLRHTAYASRSPSGTPDDDAETATNRGQVRAGVALVFMFSFMHIVTTTSLALLLVRHTGVPESGTGLVLATKAIVEMAAILVSPWLQNRWGARRSLTIAAVVAVVAYGAYLLSQGWVLGIVGAMLEGAYYGLFAAVGLTWIQSLAPERIGWATGSYMSGIYAGVLLGSPISGLVAGIWLPGITVLSMSVGLLAMALCLALPGHGRRSSAVRRTA